jgi:hypothetical protein
MPARAFAAAVSIALIAIVVSPVVRRPQDDDFPLSTYPMFATPRPTKMSLDYAIGETTAGERRTLSPSLLGTGEVLQAFMMLARAVHQGAAGTQPLCARIAAAVASDPDYADVATVRIVTGTHDAVDYLVRGQRGREIERTRCAVVRP